MISHNYDLGEKKITKKKVTNIKKLSTDRRTKTIVRNLTTKKASVKYIKKSILHTTQKIFFQKHYCFNRYVSGKLQI